MWAVAQQGTGAKLYKTMTSSVGDVVHGNLDA